MVVLNVKPTVHSLELLNAPHGSLGGQFMVCSCGWRSPTVDNRAVRAFGHAHLGEKLPPFFGFWREHGPPGRPDRRYSVLMMPTRRSWAYLFRELLDGRS